MEDFSTTMLTLQKGKLPNSLRISAAMNTKSAEKVTNQSDNDNIEFMTQSMNYDLEAVSETYDKA